MAVCSSSPQNKKPAAWKKPSDAPDLWDNELVGGALKVRSAVAASPQSVSDTLRA